MAGAPAAARGREGSLSWSFCREPGPADPLILDSRSPQWETLLQAVTSSVFAKTVLVRGDAPLSEHAGGG